MLRKLITKNAYFVRESRELFKKDSGPIITNGIFPYKLGGVSSYLPNQEKVQAQCMANKQNKQIFINIYCNLLDSIEKKDKNRLKETVEPQLIDPLLSRDDIHQINKESPIELLFNTLSIGIGVTFGNQGKKYKTLVKRDNLEVYTEDQKQSYKVMKDWTSNGYPVLHSFHIGVRSARKLAIKRSESSDQEIHLLTMEQQLIVRSQKIKEVMKSLNSEKKNETKKELLGSSNPWLIGNIDEFLKKRS